VNANGAPLTARPARRGATARKGICFFCTALRDAGEAKKKKSFNGADMKYAIQRRPLFPLGRLVATPGALAALQKAGQSPAEFLSLHVRGQ
jgi:hypothetical protein